MRSFFSSSPKKPARVVQPPPVAPPVLEENLARYLKPDGTLARAFVSFKDIASRCDTRLFETSYPLIGQRMESASKAVSMEIGELVLQFFRLPPLPGIPQSLLPQSLDECHRGLRHVHWHKMTYFEGTLTQNGGDCVVRDLDMPSCPARTNCNNIDMAKEAIPRYRGKSSCVQRCDQESYRYHRLAKGDCG